MEDITQNQASAWFVIADWASRHLRQKSDRPDLRRDHWFPAWKFLLSKFRTPDSICICAKKMKRKMLETVLDKMLTPTHFFDTMLKDKPP